MSKTNHHTLSLSSIFFLLLLCSFPTLHAQQLAVKTNGLMLAAMASQHRLRIRCGRTEQYRHLGFRRSQHLRQQSQNDRSSARIPLLV